MATSILVVEDESIVSLDIQTRLKALGLSVVGHARDGTTAIHIAGELRPDLILMDIQIQGDIDGIETARIIGDRFDIPSIFLTAFSDQKSLERAKEAHGYGYLLKPFQERELIIAIEMALFKHNAERELRSNRAILDTTLNTIEEGVITVSADGTILLLNNSAEHFTGWRQEDALGQRHDTVLNQRPAFGTGEHDGNVRAGGVIVTRRDGTEFFAEITRRPLGRPLGNRSGPPQGEVLVIRDVTALREYQQKLIDARIAAESATRAKSEFMARMSHEFRTPLNTIMGMTSLAEESLDDSKVLELLQISRSSAEEMMLMITDLLDYSALEGGCRPIRNDVFSLDDLLQAVAKTHAHSASKNGIRLAVVSDPAVPNRVSCDKRRLTQILTNLVSNAVKFTPSGYVVISVGARKTKNRCEMRFQVEDTGIGIPADKLDEVFSEFSQLADSRTRSAGGTGLGLTFARRLAFALDGDVHLAARPGGGTVAECRVPVTISSEGSDATRWWENLDRPVAASDPLVRRVLEPWLRAAGKTLLSIDDSTPSDTISVMSVDEYTSRAMSSVPGKREKVFVTGPAGGENLLTVSGADRPAYISDPFSPQALIDAIVTDDTGDRPTEPGTEPAAASADVNESLRRLREMLQNSDPSEATEYARSSKNVALDEDAAEVFFRVLLALRKNDIEGARIMVDRAIQRYVC